MERTLKHSVMLQGPLIGSNRAGVVSNVRNVPPIRSQRGFRTKLGTQPTKRLTMDESSGWKHVPAPSRIKRNLSRSSPLREQVALGPECIR